MPRRAAGVFAVWNGKCNPEWNALHASDVFVERYGNYWYNEETARLCQFLNDLYGVLKPFGIPVRLSIFLGKDSVLAIMRS